MIGATPQVIEIKRKFRSSILPRMESHNPASTEAGARNAVIAPESSGVDAPSRPMTAYTRARCPIAGTPGKTGFLRTYRQRRIGHISRIGGQPLYIERRIAAESPPPTTIDGHRGLDDRRSERWKPCAPLQRPADVPAGARTFQSAGQRVSNRTTMTRSRERRPRHRRPRQS